MILPYSAYPGEIEARCPIDDFPFIDHNLQFTRFPRWLKTVIIHRIRAWTW